MPIKTQSSHKMATDGPQNPGKRRGSRSCVTVAEAVAEAANEAAADVAESGAWSQQIAVSSNNHFDLVRNTSVAYLLVDAECTIVDANEAAAKLFRRDADALVFLSMSALVNEEDRARTRAQFRRAMVATGSSECLICAPGEARGSRRIRVSMHEVSTVEGSHCLVAFHTPADDQLDEGGMSLVSGMSRELQLPVAMLHQQLEALHERLTDSELLALSDTVMDTSHELITLVDKLVALAHVEAEGHAVVERNFEPIAAVDEVVGSWFDHASAHSVAISMTTHSEMPAAVRGDPAYIGQCLHHVIDNAVRFASAKIEISCGYRDGRVELIVKDDGPGIQAVDLPHVIQPFVKLGPEATQTGAGLGLTVTQALVARLGGHLQLNSEVGEGTSVTMTLPLEEVPQTELEQVVEQPALSGQPASGALPVSGGQAVSGGQPVSSGQAVSSGQPISGGQPVSSGQPVSGQLAASEDPLAGGSAVSAEQPLLGVPLLDDPAILSEDDDDLDEEFTQSTWDIASLPSSSLPAPPHQDQAPHDPAQHDLKQRALTQPDIRRWEPTLHTAHHPGDADVEWTQPDWDASKKHATRMEEAADSAWPSQHASWEPEESWRPKQSWDEQGESDRWDTDVPRALTGTLPSSDEGPYEIAPGSVAPRSSALLGRVRIESAREMPAYTGEPEPYAAEPRSGRKSSRNSPTEPQLRRPTAAQLAATQRRATAPQMVAALDEPHAPHARGSGHPSSGHPGSGHPRSGHPGSGHPRSSAPPRDSGHPRSTSPQILAAQRRPTEPQLAAAFLAEDEQLRPSPLSSPLGARHHTEPQMAPIHMSGPDPEEIERRRRPTDPRMNADHSAQHSAAQSLSSPFAGALAAPSSRARGRRASNHAQPVPSSRARRASAHRQPALEQPRPDPTVPAPPLGADEPLPLPPPPAPDADLLQSSAQQETDEAPTAPRYQSNHALPATKGPAMKSGQGQAMPSSQAMKADKTMKSSAQPHLSAWPESDVRRSVPRILIADQDAHLRALLMMALDDMSIPYDTVEDGAQALQMLQTKPFDGVIMDMHIPVLDGYEAIRWIRQDPKLRHLSVLALTAEALRYEEDACIAAGCDLYQSKPCAIDVLTQRLQALFALIAKRSQDAPDAVEA